MGGIADKPVVVDGQIVIRHYLCLTLSFNHAIVDGAPAARFTARLKDLIESGYGLDEREEEQEVGQVSVVSAPQASLSQKDTVKVKG